MRDGRRACGRTERGSLEELGEPTSSRPSAAKGPGGAITAEATGVDWRGNGEVAGCGVARLGSNRVPSRNIIRPKSKGRVIFSGQRGHPGAVNASISPEIGSSDCAQPRYIKKPFWA